MLKQELLEKCCPWLNLNKRVALSWCWSSYWAYWHNTCLVYRFSVVCIWWPLDKITHLEEYMLHGLRGDHSCTFLLMHLNSWWGFMTISCAGSAFPFGVPDVSARNFWETHDLQNAIYSMLPTCNQLTAVYKIWDYGQTCHDIDNLTLQKELPLPKT